MRRSRSYQHRRVVQPGYKSEYRMRIAHFFIVLSLILLSGCASLPFLQPAQAETPQALALSPNTLATATIEITEPASSPTQTALSTETLTPGPFTLQFTPPPSETPLPTLELPTPVAHPPDMQIWDGLPTYLAESKPGFYFRLRFDPDIWAATTDQFGFPALVHRQIPGCIITPSSGRGLALNGSVEHDVRKIGPVSYQVSTVFVNGVKQFVTYTGGDGNIVTAFEVSFALPADQCVTDAETVLAELRSVADFQATPISTP